MDTIVAVGSVYSCCVCLHIRIHAKNDNIDYASLVQLCTIRPRCRYLRVPLLCGRKGNSPLSSRSALFDNTLKRLERSQHGLRCERVRVWRCLKSIRIGYFLMYLPLVAKRMSQRTRALTSGQSPALQRQLRLPLQPLTQRLMTEVGAWYKSNLSSGQAACVLGIVRLPQRGVDDTVNFSALHPVSSRIIF